VRHCDALIVGGGPAGSTCARVLGRAGWDVVVVDRARFPRDKVCAGWLTPEVFDLLELAPEEYRQANLSLQEITAFRTAVLGSSPRETRYDHVVSYAIRRCEFDAFLLARAKVRTIESTPVETLRQSGDSWIVNEQLAAPVIVGAGGHFCPVARHLRGGGPDTARPVVAKEAEFPLNGGRAHSISDAPALYFCRDLGGYGWCVPKGQYINVGIGHRDSHTFASEFKSFVAFLESSNTVPTASRLRWHGHAYFASGAGMRPTTGDGVLLVGDAAGLAYPESGEGIRPAIESGLVAAQTLLAAHGRYSREALAPYAQAVDRQHPRVATSPRRAGAARAAIGRALLSSSLFTRHVVLDRWFLRHGEDHRRD
jgi:geranylgeranyl reductase family protein